MNANGFLPLLFELPGALVVVPLLGALAAPLLPRRAGLVWAALVSLAVLGLSVPLWFGCGAGVSGVHYEVDVPWFELLNAQIRIHLGVDGISLLPVLLAALLAPIAIISAAGQVRERRREFAFWMLLLETGVLGALLALDIVLFYLFLELALVPLWFLVGIWGGPGRQAAAARFAAFQLTGSLLMLPALLYVVLGSQQPLPGGELVPATTQILELARRAPLPWTAQALCFLAFAAGFAVKVPLFPLHAWAPAAHAEAPTAGSVLLGGIVLKLGAYGFLRLCLPLFPAASRHFAPWLMGLALAGILFFALLAWVQDDLKRLIAYIAMGKMGFAVLGLFALDTAALTAALLQMAGHGLSIAALLLLAGMLEERLGTVRLDACGGLARVMPRFALLLAAAVLVAIGTPGSASFRGEFWIITGVFEANPLLGGLAAAGFLLAATSLLRMAGRVLLGPTVTPESREPRDLGWREASLLAPLLALTLWIGFYPAPFTARIEAPLAETVLRTARFDPPPPGMR